MSDLTVSMVSKTLKGQTKGYTHKYCHYWILHTVVKVNEIPNTYVPSGAIICVWVGFSAFQAIFLVFI